MRSAILVNGKPCFMRDFAKQNFNLRDLTRREFKRLWQRLASDAITAEGWRYDEIAFEIVRHKNLRMKLGVV